MAGGMIRSRALCRARLDYRRSQDLVSRIFFSALLFHKSTTRPKKEKGAKRKKAATAGHIQIAPIGALNSYKGAYS
jgi:hypothetical protein